MRRIVVIVLSSVFFSIIAAGCGGNLKTLNEPPASKNTILIIGQVILQNYFYNTDQTEVIKDGIQVAVIGKIEKNGKNKIVGYWATTDKNGYFYLADLPPGQYNLKGIKSVVARGTLITIINPLKYTGSIFQIQPGEIVIFDGTYLPYKAQNRVIDLLHNVFTIDKTSENTGNVNHRTYLSLKNAKLVTGEMITEPPVPKYFLSKYPANPWKPYLEKVLINEEKSE
ncbi:hypothetical protein BMS3Abin05_00104 [bacterium BMS3Abin05]|nr:hypothetical protein BMS3Abin05_00104 [bacterium BMS3Abin05]GBE26892.1 hypothetical protein BMS3Bbin03_00812 [bacterium BMS3Bbin03]HDZ10670.1 hypothetical protein [Bacteroidota bacterium]